MFRLFFAWPGGGTWPNTIAWLEDAAIASAVLWFTRNKAGPRLARWWHSYQAEHLQAMLDEHHDRIGQRLDEHHEQIRRHLDGQS
jgi:hypothetical protein